MISIVAVIAALHGMPAQADGWVWSLYEGQRETVLAREIPGEVPALLQRSAL